MCCVCWKGCHVPLPCVLIILIYGNGREGLGIVLAETDRGPACNCLIAYGSVSHQANACSDLTRVTRGHGCTPLSTSSSVILSVATSVVSLRSELDHCLSPRSDTRTQSGYINTNTSLQFTTTKPSSRSPTMSLNKYLLAATRFGPRLGQSSVVGLQQQQQQRRDFHQTVPVSRIENVLILGSGLMGSGE